MFTLAPGFYLLLISIAGQILMWRSPHRGVVMEAAFTCDWGSDLFLSNMTWSSFFKFIFQHPFPWQASPSRVLHGKDRSQEVVVHSVSCVRAVLSLCSPLTRTHTHTERRDRYITGIHHRPLVKVLCIISSRKSENPPLARTKNSALSC